VLAAKYGSRIEVVNGAVPGQELSRLMPHGTEPIQALAAGFDLIVLNHGMNDMQHRLPLAGYTNRVNALAHDFGSRMLLQTQNPNIAEAWKIAAQPAFVDAMKKAGGRNTIDVYRFFKKLPDWQSHLPDGIHPDAAAQEAIARDVMAPAIEARLNVCEAK
jgi:lysophospholipase L1-like esterase